MNRARVIQVFLTAIFLSGFAAPALAEPANDTMLNERCSCRRSLPFSGELDTTQATTDADDAELNAACGAPATDASVWYELRASTDTVISVDASQSSGFSLGMIIATGSPGSFQVVRLCVGRHPVSDERRPERYVMLVFDYQADQVGNGGALRIQIAQSTEAFELLKKDSCPPRKALFANFTLSGIPGTLFYQIPVPPARRSPPSERTDLPAAGHAPAPLRQRADGPGVGGILPAPVCQPA